MKDISAAGRREMVRRPVKKTRFSMIKKGFLR